MKERKKIFACLVAALFTRKAAKFLFGGLTKDTLVKNDPVLYIGV